MPMRAIFNYTQGKYKVIIEGTGSSQLLLTKDNVVSEVKLQGESKSEKYNRVIGTFTNPEKDYQSDTVSYPPFDDSGLAVEDQHATMLSDDNNYFQFLIDRFLYSTTNGAIITGISNMIYGKGLDALDASRKPN